MDGSTMKGISARKAGRVGDQAAVAPDAVDAVETEDVGDRVVAVPDKEEVDQVERGPRHQQVEHQSQRVQYRVHRAARAPEVAEQVPDERQREDRAGSPRRLVLIFLNESMPVSTLSMPP